jgi:hypothetical protein
LWSVSLAEAWPLDRVEKVGQPILAAAFQRLLKKAKVIAWPPMNTDERRLRTTALSAFISVDRRLNLPFPDFFSNLFQAARLTGKRSASIQLPHTFS